MKLPHQSDEAQLALKEMRPGFTGIAALTFALAIFPVAVMLFLLLVFDVALPGHSVPTLVGVWLLILIVVGVHCFLSILRRRMLAYMGEIAARTLLPRLDEATARLAEASPNANSDGMQTSRDIDAIRHFLGARTASAWLDIAALPLLLITAIFLHGWVALSMLIAAMVMLFVLWRTVRALEQPARDLVTALARRHAISETGRTNIGIIRALGLRRHAIAAWMHANSAIANMFEHVGEHTGRQGYGARALLFIAFATVLGVGGLLAIDDKATPAIVMAAGMLAWMALDPIVTAIEQAPSFVAARQGWARLDTVLFSVKGPPDTLALPAPSQRLDSENMSIVFAGNKRPSVFNISFSLKAGDVLAIVGPEGSGKSTVLAGLTGALPIAAGKVRLDGAALDQWDVDQLGRHVGYLPQTVDLLDGTVAENIARFDPDADPQDVVKAAQAAGAHDLIVRLPDGYGSFVGWNARRLSQAQAQRIALARALYGDPFLVALDGPTAHVDQAGERAILSAIESARARGAIVLMTANSSALIAVASHVLMLRDGTMVEFGERDDVQKRLADKRAARENTTTTQAATEPAASSQPKTEVPS